MLFKQLREKEYLHSIKLNGAERVKISISSMPVRALYLNTCNASLGKGPRLEHKTVFICRKQKVL
jgi:hypothetical protein